MHVGAGRGRRTNALGEAVSQLCDYMDSLKIKEVAAAAEARLSELENRMAAGAHGGGGGVGGALAVQLEHRMGALEAALAQEQQSSLKALQAILEHAQTAEAH